VHRHRLFTLHILRQPGTTSVGVVVSRRWGTAVERNRFRRLVREVVRLNREAFADMELIVRPTDGGRECGFWELQRELLSAVSAAQRSEA
jgi:ribonuclease P protein component